MHLPTATQLPQHRHLQRFLRFRREWQLRFNSRFLDDAVAGREVNALGTDGIDGGLVVDDGEEVFALEGAEEAGFCAAVAVVDDACVDEGAEEGDAGNLWISRFLRWV